MANQLYTPSGKPAAGTLGSSAELRAESVLVEAAFDIINVSHFLLTWDDFNTIGSRSFVAPFNGDITLLEWVIDANNATTDTIITVEIATVLVTMPALTQALADVAGNIETSVPTALNAFLDGDRIEVISDGAGSSVMPGSIMVYVNRTA